MELASGEIQEMLEQAVYQQLFNTNREDRIMGKNPEYTMQFTGVRKLLDRFLGELRDNIPLLLDLKIHDFLNIFEKRFKIDLGPTEERIENNFEGMGGKELLKDQPTMIIYMVLTKMIEEIREHAYAKWGKNRIMEKYKEFSGNEFSDEIDELLNRLAALNNPDISLLYNLTFITELADVYNEKRFLTTGKRLCTRKINTIIKEHLLEKQYNQH